MEIFELLNEQERRLFIKEWWGRKGWLVKEIKEAMEGFARWDRALRGGDSGLRQMEGIMSNGDGDGDENLRMQELERRRGQEGCQGR